MLKAGCFLSKNSSWFILFFFKYLWCYISFQNFSLYICYYFFIYSFIIQTICWILIMNQIVLWIDAEIWILCILLGCPKLFSFSQDKSDMETFLFAFTNVLSRWDPIVLLLHSPGGFPGIIRNWPLCAEGREKLKKEADHCGFGGRFNKQGYLTN